MNILFFLKPKSEVAYLYDDYSLRQTLEKMEYHRYSAIPIINRRGEYIGTITEGDLLNHIKQNDMFCMMESEHINIQKVKRRMDNRPVNINCNIEDLIFASLEQNFVPVVDDQKRFIGIITRRDIIQYCFSELQKKNN